MIFVEIYAVVMDARTAFLVVTSKAMSQVTVLKVNGWSTVELSMREHANENATRSHPYLPEPTMKFGTFRYPP